MPEYDKLLDGHIPPFMFRLIKRVGKSINTYNMIRKGEKVLLAISGGKDSLFLALALALRLHWLPVSYQLEAVMIEWQEYKYSQEQKDALQRYFDKLSIPFTMLSEKQENDGFKGEFNCYLCARNRRRILFNLAAERGINLIAMGHHIDDIVETSLMNLAFRARIESMNPVQDFFQKKLYVIRPLCEIDEKSIARASKTFELPVCKNSCPFDKTNVRASLKPIVEELSRMDKYTREHIFNAYGFKGR